MTMECEEDQACELWIVLTSWPSPVVTSLSDIFMERLGQKSDALRLYGELKKNYSSIALNLRADLTLMGHRHADEDIGMVFAFLLFSDV